MEERQQRNADHPQEKGQKAEEFVLVFKFDDLWLSIVPNYFLCVAVDLFDMLELS